MKLRFTHPSIPEHCIYTHIVERTFTQTDYSYAHIISVLYTFVDSLMPVVLWEVGGVYKRVQEGYQECRYNTKTLTADFPRRSSLVSNGIARLDRTERSGRDPHCPKLRSECEAGR